MEIIYIMLDENNKLRTATSAVEYLAPSVKVREIHTRKVLCQSVAGTQEYEDGGSIE